MNYTRADAGAGKNKNQGQQPENQNLAPPAAETPIKVDGFEQVLEMLKIADNSFRESLLKRLAQRDPVLARNLRAELANN